MKLKLGFPGEHHPRHSDRNLIYACRPSENSIVYVWERSEATNYGVNLYCYPHQDPSSPTHIDGRFKADQGPIICADALELQLAINHLIQKHLPTEVTVNEEA